MPDYDLQYLIKQTQLTFTSSNTFMQKQELLQLPNSINLLQVQMWIIPLGYKQPLAWKQEAPLPPMCTLPFEPGLKGEYNILQIHIWHY